MVEALAGDELVVGSALYYDAFVHDNDMVGVAYGGESVGDDNACAALHEAVEGLLHSALAFGVEG